MTVEEAADKLGIEVQQLFVRAKNMYGTPHSGNPTNDHGRYKAYGEGLLPSYVRQYLGYVERMRGAA